MLWLNSQACNFSYEFPTVNSYHSGPENIGRPSLTARIPGKIRQKFAGFMHFASVNKRSNLAPGATDKVTGCQPYEGI